MRKAPQLLLQLPGLFEQMAVVLLAFLEGPFDHAPLGDFPFELQVGGVQLHRAIGEHPVNTEQMVFGLEGSAVGFLDWADELSKKILRSFEQAVLRTGQTQSHQGLFVYSGEVQRMQAIGQSLVPQMTNRPQVRRRISLQVHSQGGLIAS